MVIAMVTGDEGEGAMFRKATTITAVGAALVLALPATALGQSSERFGDGPVNQIDEQATQVAMLTARERSFEAKGQVEQASPLDAREAAFGAKRDAQLTNVPGPDAFERAVITNQRSKPVIVVDDRFRLDPNTGVEPGPVQVTNSRDIEWPQVGIGLGIGLVLMIGLYLALKATRQRPLAH
jgi:hypothetical protein